MKFILRIFFKFFLKILLTALAVLIIEKILPGISVETDSTAIWVAVVLGILYALLKPLLVVLTLPVTILTLGLFLLVINAVLILLTGNLVDGFTVSGFWSALFFSILLSVFESFLYGLVDNK